MTKQTAVEWLAEQISTSKYFYKLMEDINSRSTIAKSDIIKQAKAMHKDEVTSFTADWSIQYKYENGKNINEYYNETFKSE